LYSILVFFYLICYGLSIMVGEDAFSWTQLGGKFFCVSRGGNWFVQCYLFLMLLSPILNAFVEKCKEKSLLIFIGIYMACMFYFSAVWDSTYFYFNHGYSVTTFICLYLVGRYVRLYGVQHAKAYPKWRMWFSFLACMIFMTILRFVCNNEERWLSYESPFLIIPSALLLICFAQLQFNSKIVNWLAPACLGAFIFHTCDSIIDWMIHLDVEWFNTQPFAKYILSMGGVILVVYLTAAVLDALRRFIMSPILKGIDNLILKYGNNK